MVSVIAGFRIATVTWGGHGLAVGARFGATRRRFQEATRQPLALDAVAPVLITQPQNATRALQSGPVSSSVWARS